MTWTLEYNSSLQMIHLVLQGTVGGPEIHEATSEAISLLKKHDAMEALVDITEMELAPPIIDIYELPAKQYVLEDVSHDVRIAVVVPETSGVKEAARFYETVCVNRGWGVRLFQSHGDAIEWLTDTASSRRSESNPQPPQPLTE